MDFADLDETFFANAGIAEVTKNRWRALGVNLNEIIAVVFARYGKEGIASSACVPRA